MLRYDIDKFKDAEGLTWTKQFSIYDEADAQSLVKEIVTQELQLDPKRFEPKKTRWAISNAKNQGWLPDQFEANAEGQQGKLTADVYQEISQGVSGQQRLGFRRSVAATGSACSSSMTRYAATGTDVFVTFWWTSIRTPTGPSTS